MYVVHNLQSQLEGVHVLIITFGTISQVFGPLKLNVFYRFYVESCKTFVCLKL